MAKTRSSRGLVIVLIILIAAAAAAFWAMRETLDKGEISLPGARSGAESGAGSGEDGQARPSDSEYHGRVEGMPQSGAPSSPDSGAGTGSIPGGSEPGSTAPEVSGPGSPGETARPGAGGPALPGTAPSSSALPGSSPDPGVGQETGQGAPGETQPQTPADGNGPAGDSGAAPILDVPAPRVQTPEEAFEDPAPGASGEGDAPQRPASFFDDAARFLVANYWPKGTHPSATRGGISTAGLKTANTRYGTEAHGIQIGGQSRLTGAAALSRFFTPGMLDSLYSSYADDFMEAMSAAADARRVGQGQARRALTAPERAEMYTIYASRARGLAATLNAYADNPNARALVEELNYAESAVYAANRDYLESTAEYEIAVEEKLPGAGEAKALMEQDAAAYQERILERERVRQNLAQALGSALDEDSRIYTASWAYRRGPDGTPALRESATILINLAARLDAQSR